VLAAVVRQERLLRSQVLKQADVIQLVALFPHEFDVRQMRVAYDTYAPLTSHDSSLSHAVHALVAARCGRDAAALAHWNASVQLDLQPPHASEGVHAACGGGNWQAVVFGFAGLRSRLQSEVLDLDPRLPAAWTRLRFPFVWTGQPLRFELAPGHVAISHGGTRPIRAVIRGAPYTLEPGHTYEFELVEGRPA
jgi:kojibiose phosphorylase